MPSLGLPLDHFVFVWTILSSRALQPPSNGNNRLSHFRESIWPNSYLQAVTWCWQTQSCGLWTYVQNMIKPFLPASWSAKWFKNFQAAWNVEIRNLIVCWNFGFFSLFFFPNQLLLDLKVSGEEDVHTEV